MPFFVNIIFVNSFNKFKKRIKSHSKKIIFRLNKYRFHILGSLLSLILAIIVIELALHINTSPNTLLACKQQDKDIHHRLVPNSMCNFKTGEWDINYRINSLGLRDDEIKEKEDGEYRILVLGDSFVEGYGVEEKARFTEILQNLLRNEGFLNVHVINAGVASYSPILEYLMLQKIYDQIKPDLILAGLDMTDFFDEIGYWNFYISNQPEPEKTEPILEEYTSIANKLTSQQKDLRQFRKETKWFEPERKISLKTRFKMVLRKSKIYVFTTNIIKDYLNKPYLADGSPAFIPGDIDTDLFAIIRQDLPEEKYQTLWKLPKLSFKKISDFAGQKNAKLAFFTYPHGMQVDGKQWAKGRLTRGFLRGQVYSDKPLVDLEIYGKEINVPVFNLHNDLYVNSSEKLYFDWDGHFTNEGHKTVANSLKNFLVKSSLLTKK